MSDITSFVKACLLILGVATSLGHFEDVQKWAIMEFAKSLKTTNSPHFFRLDSVQGHSRFKKKPARNAQFSRG